MEINYGYLLLDFIITIIAYLFLPFIIFYKKNDRYDIKERKKIIIFNSIVISGCFILYRVINDYKNAMISFAPAIFYYYVNKFIWCKTKKDKKERSENGIKTDKKNKKSKSEDKIKTIFIFVIILFLITSITVSLSIGIKEKAEKDKLQLKLDNENANEEKRQNSLANCIANAKTARNNLWNANCTKQTNGSCTINNNSGTIEWIEKRYQQDLNNCYQLYGN